MKVSSEIVAIGQQIGKLYLGMVAGAIVLTAVLLLIGCSSTSVLGGALLASVSCALLMFSAHLVTL